MNKSKRSRIKVICLNTKEVFDSMSDASKKFSVKKSGISASCKKGISGGKLNEEKLYWMYYNDYLFLDDTEKENILDKLSSTKSRKSIKVICLNDEKIYDSIKEASKTTNIDDSSIIRCCKGQLASAGKINGDKACWMYLEDYLQSQTNNTSREEYKRNNISIKLGDVYKHKINNNLIQINGFANPMDSSNYSESIIIFSNISKSLGIQGNNINFSLYGTQKDIEKQYELLIKQEDICQYDSWDEIFNLVK